MFSKTLFAFCFATASVMAAAPPASPVDVQQVNDDAKTVKRIAEVAGKDLPKNVLERIVRQDIDIIRGKRLDGTYSYAHYEPEESSRKKDDFTVGGNGTLTTGTLKDDFSYRLIVFSPSRRMLVRRNKRIYVDHIDLETTPIEGQTKTESVPVGLWIEPGSEKSFELGGVMRHVNAAVYAKVDDKDGPGTLGIALLEAKIRDNSDSPYLATAGDLTLMLENLQKGESSNLRTVANMVSGSLQAKMPPCDNASKMETVSIASIPVVVPPQQPFSAPPAATGGHQATPVAEMVVDLQNIEDLLTGSDSERREGLDRLHQLIRRLRSQE